MADPRASRTPGDRKAEPSEVSPSSNVQLPEEVEAQMHVADRVLHDMILDYRKRHPEVEKRLNRPADATPTDQSP